MKLSTLIYSTLISSVAFSAFAEDVTNYKNDTLTGSFLGDARTSLSKMGIDTDIIYKYDVLSNISGGTKKSTRALDNLDILFSIDGEHLANLPGTSAFIHILNNHGGRPNDELIGSAQGIDNIEVNTNTAKLYQAWIQQNFLKDTLSVLAGLYDVNSEFYVTDASSLFLHPTYGIGTEISQAGENGPSIFPTTSVGARVKYQPTGEIYAQVAVLDGVPGSIGNEKGTHIQFNNGDGTLTIIEAGYTPLENTKIAVGAWRFSHKFDDTHEIDNDGDAKQHHNQGAYIIGQHQLYTPKGGEGKGLAGFIRFGAADQDVNQFDYAWSTGFVYTGLIPSRDEGKLGIAVAGAHTAKKFKQAAADEGVALKSQETAFELTYSDKLTPWLAVQPNVQYIVNPGTASDVDNALVVGARFTVNF